MLGWARESPRSARLARLWGEARTSRRAAQAPRARCSARAPTPQRRSGLPDPRRAPRSLFLRPLAQRPRAPRPRRLVDFVAPADFAKAPRALQAAPTRARARGEHVGRYKLGSWSSGPRAQRRPRGARAPGSTSTRHVQPGSPRARARLLARPQAASATGASSSRAQEVRSARRAGLRALRAPRRGRWHAARGARAHGS